MLEQLIGLNVFSFLLIFSRIGSAIMILPGFGQRYVNVQTRLTFSLALSLLLTPVLINALPAQPGELSAMFALVLSEILIGIFLGLIPRIIVSALQTAGTVLALVSSMANMFILDPISEQQSALLSTFLGTMGLTLIFVTNTHHIMLQAVTESYSLFIPGQPLMVGDMTDTLARYMADSFSLGVQIASPLILSGVAYYVGLGILGRLMPALPVFFFGLPIQISIQLYLLIVTISGMMLVFMAYIQDELLRFIPGT